MKRYPDWDDFAQTLDYRTTHTKTHSLIRWISWEETATDLRFQWETALGETANLGDMASKFHKLYSINNL